MKRVTQLLDDIEFPIQPRNNTIDGDNEQRGFVLGMINPRGKGRWKGSDLRMSRRNSMKKYQEVWTEACNLILRENPDFQFTSIQFNKNNKCSRHKDRYNKRESAMIGLGDYTNGELKIYDEDGGFSLHDTHHKWIIFDGGKYEHETMPFEGTRYTLVYFTI